MNADDIIRVLVRAGLAEDYEAIVTMPEGRSRRAAMNFSAWLSRCGLVTIERLSSSSRAAFVKALAIYEDRVGGIGSVTAIEKILPLVQDEKPVILDFILSKTSSYYYSMGARSYAELQKIKAMAARLRVMNQLQEDARKQLAKKRKAEQATANLFNAIRRGDVQAVQPLLRKGANTEGITPEGKSIIQFAVESKRNTIAQLLHLAQAASLSHR